MQEISNSVNHGKGDPTKSSKGPVSRLPRRCANNNNNKNKTALSTSNKSDMNNAKDNDNNRSLSLEKNVSYLNAVPDSNETVPKTPVGCIAARIRSYSALRRSQWKRKSKDCSDSNKENVCCSPANTSPLGETGCGPMTTEVENNSDLSSEVESDEDILWKMNRRHSDEKEDMAPTKVSEFRKAHNYCQNS